MAEFEEGDDDENVFEEEDDDSDDDFDDDDDDDEDDNMEDEEDSEGEEDLDDDDDGPDVVEISLDSEIPLAIGSGNEIELDEEALKEVNPSEISESSWSELEMTFEDLVDLYGSESVWELELAIDYDLVS
ncbi:MAG: hypothetical protein ACMG51_09625 [Ginsengibacter sp.]